MNWAWFKDALKRKEKSTNPHNRIDVPPFRKVCVVNDVNNSQGRSHVFPARCFGRADAVRMEADDGDVRHGLRDEQTVS
jgi:hypothetical protein